jgi:hypothetical protein
VTNWRDWHEHYSDPESSLSRRLLVVQRRLDELLSMGSVRRIVSLCAGDGRDIIPVLAGLPARQRPETVLVEIDPVLASAAERRAVDARVTVDVVVGDAGMPETWVSATPVDLLMLCGIFGNVSDDDILATIRATPNLLSPEGAVIWTRGAFGDRDLRPQVRQWFAGSGFVEVSYDSEAEGFGVGVTRVTEAAERRPLPDRLFSFVR